MAEDLLGNGGQIRPGDRLLGIDGVPYPLLMFEAVNLRRPHLSFRPGEVKTYTVLRGGAEVDVSVPVHVWTAGGVARAAWRTLTSSPWGGIYRWLAWALAAYVFLRRPDLTSARLFFLLESVMLGAVIATSVAPVSVPELLSPALFYATRFAGDLFTWLLAPPLALHLILAFPGTRTPPRLALWLIYLVPWLVLAIVWVYGAAQLVPVMTTAYSVLGLAAVLRLVYLHGAGHQAARVRWFAFAFAVSNLFSLAFWLQQIGVIPHVPVLHALMFEHCICDLIYVVGFAIAILWHGLFDVDIVIGRTLVYLALTALVVAVYAALVGGVGSLVEASSSLPLSLAATAVVALAFDPARRRLQRGANRLLYGFRDEPYEILSRLGDVMRAAPQPGGAIHHATKAVAEALRLPFAAVRLGTVTATTYGEPRQAAESFPLSHGGQVLGELVVAPRQAEGRLSPTDRKLLESLAVQVGTVAHSLKLEAGLELERLVSLNAREEERRRLGSDLHDDVGHRLTWLARQAQGAASLVETNPDAARAALSALGEEAQSVKERVRTLAHRLHPPELSLLGLVGAVAERLQVLQGGSSVRFQLEADELGELPAAIELAAYHIAQEALSNVLEHAEARTCRVRIYVVSKTDAAGVVPARRYLLLEVHDDGQKRWDVEQPRGGLGLASMRVRAREVGGTLAIVSQPDGGTTVSATLPFPGE